MSIALKSGDWFSLLDDDENATIHYFCVATDLTSHSTCQQVFDIKRNRYSLKGSHLYPSETFFSLREFDLQKTPIHKVSPYVVQGMYGPTAVSFVYKTAIRWLNQQKKLTT